jgi:hypothetical protein
MFLKRLMIPFGILAFISLTHAQQASTTAAKDPQAVSILSQSLNAVGGLSAISGIQDYTGTGNITYNWAGDSVPAPVTVRGMGIANFRLDAALPDGTRTFAVSGYSGVLISPDGTRQPTSAYNFFTAGSLNLPYVRLASCLTDATTAISFVGNVSANGQQVYQVHFATAPLPSVAATGSLQTLGAFDLYIDPASFLVIKLEESVYSDSNIGMKLSHEIAYTNYQTSGNIRVPLTVTETVNGQQTWSMTLSSIAFNSGLAIAEFNP